MPMRTHRNGLQMLLPLIFIDSLIEVLQSLLQPSKKKFFYLWMNVCAGPCTSPRGKLWPLPSIPTQHLRPPGPEAAAEALPPGRPFGIDAIEGV